MATAPAPPLGSANDQSSAWASLPSATRNRAMSVVTTSALAPGETPESTWLRAVWYPAVPEKQALFTSNRRQLDRKSTRLNSSHVSSSYAVFSLKQNNQ